MTNADALGPQLVERVTMDADSLGDDVSQLCQSSFSHHTLHRRGFSAIREEDSRYFRSTQSLLERRLHSAQHASESGAADAASFGEQQAEQTAVAAAAGVGDAEVPRAKRASSDALSSCKPNETAKAAPAPVLPGSANGQTESVTSTRERGHYAHNPLFNA